MPASFTGPLARRLDNLCTIGVTEVSQSTELEPGTAYIGRGDADLIVSRRGTRLLAMSAPINSRYRWHPSVDRLVESAMDAVMPQQLIGILMTGMGDDGAAAMRRLHELGGTTIAEAKDSAVVWGMPGSLVALGGASETVTLDRICQRLLAEVS
jgi:two-component system chemotaxis response regulator CheB